MLLLAAHGCASQGSGAPSDAGLADDVTTCSVPQDCLSQVGRSIYCCLDHACTSDAPGACSDGSQRPILASSYDQSCQTDTDCFPIGEGNACSVVSPCPNATINKSAYAKYQSDIAGAPCSVLVGCPYSLPPCCSEGKCVLAGGECASRADARRWLLSTRAPSDAGAGAGYVRAMAWQTLIAILALTAGCSGSDHGSYGTCARASARAGGGWLCTTPMADASRRLESCSGETRAGGACTEQETVDTTNTTEPMHVTGYPECFLCTSPGTGTDWKCTASGWQAAASFNCSQ